LPSLQALKKFHEGSLPLPADTIIGTQIIEGALTEDTETGSANNDGSPAVTMAERDGLPGALQKENRPFKALVIDIAHRQTNGVGFQAGQQGGKTQSQLAGPQTDLPHRVTGATHGSRHTGHPQRRHQRPGRRILDVHQQNFHFASLAQLRPPAISHGRSGQ
jgi:hypothetical protein